MGKWAAALVIGAVNRGAADPLIRDARFTATGAEMMRNAWAAQSRSYWQLGDVLVTELGATPATGQRDGSQLRMAVAADALGVRPGAMAQWRHTSSAWVKGTRREVEASWSVHRLLRCRPDRVDVLAAFLADCRGLGVTPGRPRLDAFLADGWAPRRRSPVTTLAAAIGRVEADVGACDPVALVHLADRLDAVVAHVRDRRLVAVS